MKVKSLTKNSKLLHVLAILVLMLMTGSAIAHTESENSQFNFRDVVVRAKKLAKKPWEKPSKAPKFLRNISYSQYHQIRLKGNDWLWSGQHSRFEIGPIAPGNLYNHTVKLSVVSSSGIHAIPYKKGDFTYPSSQLKRKIPADLGYAGFQVSYRFGRRKTSRRSFLVFLGASYFRGIAGSEVYGTSARGVAIDTGLPSGEQFPRFSHYWFVRPNSESRSMTFYALLRGKSLTGAYRFVVWPGKPSRVEVKARLFARKSIKLLGVAPLTSMFLYGANTPRPPSNWRPQVHDSDGLLIHNGSGEWLWRPLRNPAQLKTYYFNALNPRGFGLLQRGTKFAMYQSLGARYGERPSVWVQPDSRWGKGGIMLFEIPSKSHNNDNIVAFWRPRKHSYRHKDMTLRYTLTFGNPRIPREPLGHAATTLVGLVRQDHGSHVPKNAYHINVDFSGGPLAKLPAGAPVTGVVSAENGGKVIEHYVQYISPLHQWRLDIVARPSAPTKALRLRAYLKQGKHTLTETWSYGLPADNRIREASK